MFLGWKVGLQEILFCGVVILVLIVIPALVVWKTRRLGKKD